MEVLVIVLLVGLYVALDKDTSEPNHQKTHI
jgi:hypothetical protein